MSFYMTVFSCNMRARVQEGAEFGDGASIALCLRSFVTCRDTAASYLFDLSAPGRRSGQIRPLDPDGAVQITYRKNDEKLKDQGGSG